jgi:putative Ca2+/H+ antiporter (TMEM165/GDT1 family)
VQHEVQAWLKPSCDNLVSLVFAPAGVAVGAIVGHILATAIAVIGGSVLSEHINERTVGYIGGTLFFIFAVGTLAGVV